jgi:hypothetical protein
MMMAHRNESSVLLPAGIVHSFAGSILNEEEQAGNGLAVETKTWSRFRDGKNGA